jgi:long-chain acyl-CoA synthetase
MVGRAHLPRSFQTGCRLREHVGLAIMSIMADSVLQTIPAFFREAVARRRDEPALGFIRAGELHWRTWGEVAADAARLAAMMRDAGVEPGDRVAHVSENCYEWITTDLAMHLAGAVHVPIHITLSGQQIAEQICDCDAQMVFVSSEELLAKFSHLLGSNVTVQLRDSLANPATLRVAKNREMAKPEVAPDDLATILYTSGTTGRSRGVMLSQRNLASNAAAVAEFHGAGTDQTRLCLLPLSHIYARTCDLYTWVYRGSRLVLAEHRETLARDCQLAQPTALSAVPYLYQRIADRIRAAAPRDESQALRAFFGGRMERLSCGGAALSPDVEAWFAERGLHVLPGYGLTETSPVVATSTIAGRRMGSVGRLLPNVEVRIADDGEILVRGSNVMLGYWHDEDATEEVLRDGWLHTGDLGKLDAVGFLYIDGRKKEMIALSTGNKAFPTRVESLLTASPLIEQAAVFGEGEPALVALIVASAGGVTESGAEPPDRRQIGDEINRCLAAASREEQVRAFAVLDRPFSIEQGELTPKLSLCRQVIARNFAAELTSLYQSLNRPAAPDATRTGA